MRSAGLLVLTVCSLVGVLLPQTGNAHNPRFSYIWLQVNEDGLQGRIEGKAADFNRATGLDISFESG